MSDFTFGTTNEEQPSTAIWWEVLELDVILSQSWQLLIDKTPDNSSLSPITVTENIL